MMRASDLSRARYFFMIWLGLVVPSLLLQKILTSQYSPPAALRASVSTPQYAGKEYGRGWRPEASPCGGIGITGVDGSVPLLLCCFPLPHEGPDQ